MKFIDTTQYVIFMLIISLSSYQVIAEKIDSSNNQSKINKWNFVAYLDDDKIGYHNFEVIENNGEVVVNTEAKFDVTFMFIPVYSYEHNNTEIWNNDCLTSMDSRTLDDGEELFVQLSSQNGTSKINTHDKSISQADCVRSFAYWDYDLIKSKALLNSQTGELIDVSYRFVGSDVINVNNKPLQARHYQLLGKDGAGNLIDISLWYNSNNHWLALHSRLDNGYSLRYQLEKGVEQ